MKTANIFEKKNPKTPQKLGIHYVLFTFLLHKKTRRENSNLDLPVVCPLHNGVSRQTSANWPRLTCSSFAATFEKTMAPFLHPIC